MPLTNQVLLHLSIYKLGIKTQSLMIVLDKSGPNGTFCLLDVDKL